MSRPAIRSCLHAVALMLALCSASCRQQAPPAANAGKPADDHALTERKASLIVSAAASTTEAVEALCAEFAEKRGVEVKVNAGPSSGLAAQIINGAPANVFLSANQQWADEVEKAGRVEARHDLATNGLALVVPRGNPAQVATPQDLLSDNVQKVALAGEQVPAGIYAEQALKKLGLFDKLSDAGKIVRGQDVRTALAYVERGEAEAGIVYTTDVQAARGVEQALEFDPALHDKIVYVLVLLKSEEENDEARKLYQFLRSPEAMPTFEKFGFTSLDKPSSASPAANN